MNLLAPANFSPDRVHRYTLCRRVALWSDIPLVACGYNPSNAAEVQNDNTIQREINLAARCGCGYLIKVNLFAAVHSDPNYLATLADPVGPDNDKAIREAIETCLEWKGILLAAWGAPKGKPITKRQFIERARYVAGMSKKWNVLRLTKFGHPEHPLYLPNDLRPTAWRGYRLGQL